jgi:hypothetical protein
VQGVDKKLPPIGIAQSENSTPLCTKIENSKKTGLKRSDCRFLMRPVFAHLDLMGLVSQKPLRLSKKRQFDVLSGIVFDFTPKISQAENPLISQEAFFFPHPERQKSPASW